VRSQRPARVLRVRQRSQREATRKRDADETWLGVTKGRRARAYIAPDHLRRSSLAAQ
jgi:hypothetical protein